VKSMHGNFFVQASDRVVMPAIPLDQSYAIEFQFEETLTEPVVVFQTALLHTTSSGAFKFWFQMPHLILYRRLFRRAPDSSHQSGAPHHGSGLRRLCFCGRPSNYHAASEADGPAELCVEPRRPTGEAIPEGRRCVHCIHGNEPNPNARIGATVAPPREPQDAPDFSPGGVQEGVCVVFGWSAEQNDGFADSDSPEH
jgi:hypothetical protein